MSMDVNVAVVGDEGVGKTSLILSATQRNFRPGEPVTALPGTSVKVKLANADWKDGGRNRFTKCLQQLDASVNQAANLVRYDKCSAMHPDSTAEVFQHACDACVNPMLPLYHHVRERLRSTAIRAFNRIFDIVDEDKDGALSDTELNQFHVFAFGRPPRVDELTGLKQALMERAPDSVTTLGITRSGFMQLQAMMIQQQRLDICWNMLRSFGYNRQLNLDPAVYESVPEQPGSVGMVCMLSATAVDFLKSIFRHRCTASNVFPIDLLLQDTGPASLFHNAPPAATADDHPLGWANIRQLLVRSSDPRYLPLESFLGVWAYCAMINPRRTVMAMMYLGYPDGYGRLRHVLGTTAASQLLVYSARRRQPNMQPVPRPLESGVRVFNGLLFGGAGCGKSHLLELFSACPQGRVQVSQQHADGLKAARLLPGQGKHPDTLLVMQEVPIATAEDLCISALKDQAKQDMLLNNDIMLFGFDSVSSDSYAQARSLLVSLSDASNNVVPVALVGLKADLGVSSDITSMAAGDCEELKVKLLRGLSVEMTGAASQDDEQARARDWASQVVELACQAAGNIAMTPSVVAKRVRTETMWRYTKYLTATAAVLAGLGIAYQVYHHMSLQANQSRQDKSAGHVTPESRPARSGTSVWKR